MSKTNIEWCDLTINPIIGCTKCSPGCDNCYAERWAARMARIPVTKKAYGQVMENGRWNGQTHFDPTCFSKLPQKPARIFVGSMGDVFHETVSQMQIDALFNMMSKWPQHTFMLLTKRARRMRDMVMDIWNRYPDKSQPWVLPNVWLGVTAENQAMADERIHFLLATPAAKRFVSVEPMLGPVDFSRVCGDDHLGLPTQIWPLHGGRGLDWVIVGAESGPDARPMGLDWARSIRDQCRAARAPFFMKQVSGKKPIPADLMVREFPGE